VPFPFGWGGGDIDIWVCDCNVRFGGMIGVAERWKRSSAGVGERRFSICREQFY